MAHGGGLPAGSLTFAGDQGGGRRGAPSPRRRAWRRVIQQQHGLDDLGLGHRERRFRRPASRRARYREPAGAPTKRRGGSMPSARVCRGGAPGTGLCRRPSAGPRPGPGCELDRDRRGPAARSALIAEADAAEQAAAGRPGRSPRRRSGRGPRGSPGRRCRRRRATGSHRRTGGRRSARRRVLDLTQLVEQAWRGRRAARISAP